MEDLTDDEKKEYGGESANAGNVLRNNYNSAKKTFKAE